MLESGMTPILFAKKMGHARVRRDPDSFSEKKGGHARVGVTRIFVREQKYGSCTEKPPSGKYSDMTPVRTEDFWPDCPGQGMTPILFAKKWGHVRIMHGPNSFREKIGGHARVGVTPIFFVRK